MNKPQLKKEKKWCRRPCMIWSLILESHMSECLAHSNNVLFFPAHHESAVLWLTPTCHSVSLHYRNTSGDFHLQEFAFRALSSLNIRAGSLCSFQHFMEVSSQQGFSWSMYWKLQPIPPSSSTPHPLPPLFFSTALITICHILYFIYLFSAYLAHKNIAFMKVEK